MMTILQTILTELPKIQELDSDYAIDKMEKTTSELDIEFEFKHSKESFVISFTVLVFYIWSELDSEYESIDTFVKDIKITNENDFILLSEEAKDKLINKIIELLK